MPTDEVARLAGIDPSQVLRFDQNTPPLPARSTRPGAIAGALARVNGYPAGGYRALRAAIADYAGVDAGARRARSGRRRPDPALRARLRRAGRRDRDPAGADLPALPHRGAARRSARSRRLRAGCSLWHSPATRTTRPASSMSLPDVRPLVVDEAYFEYSGADGCAAARRRRDRPAHVLEALRPRRGAHRLRARRTGDGGRVERASGAGADLDACRPRSRSRRSPTRPTSSRCSRSVRGSRRHCARSAWRRSSRTRTSSTCRSKTAAPDRSGAATSRHRRALVRRCDPRLGARP